MNKHGKKIQEDMAMTVRGLNFKLLKEKAEINNLSDLQEFINVVEALQILVPASQSGDEKINNELNEAYNRFLVLRDKVSF